MTSHSYRSILAITICLLNFFFVHGQLPNNNNDPVSRRKLEFDTSKTTIIPFVQEQHYPFDKSYKSATLTQEDIDDIDSLVIACVGEYNNSFDKDHKQKIIDLIKYSYRKQLIVATNRKGEKEVWVNCFCDTWGSDRWKTEIMIVDDGGNCYFNFKINLKTKKYYDLGVNGEA
jgi:hypothetical protein